MKKCLLLLCSLLAFWTTIYAQMSSAITVRAVQENTFTYTIKAPETAPGEKRIIVGIYHPYGEAGVIICGKYDGERWGNIYYYISPTDSNPKITSLTDNQPVVAEVTIIDTDFYGYGFLVEVDKVSEDTTSDIISSILPQFAFSEIEKCWKSVQAIDLISISNDFAVGYMSGYLLDDEGWREFTSFPLADIDGTNGILLYHQKGVRLPPEESQQRN